MRTSFVLRVLVSVCVLMGAAAVSAQQTAVPRLVQFGGVLKDAASHPVAGVSSVTFAIYAEQEGGTALWSETQNVLADANGHYSIVLGAATTGGFPVELFGTGQSRWLGIAITRQPELPRILMASVPYALKAGDAETLGGLPASSYVTTQQLAVRTTSPVFTGGSSTIIATPGVAIAQSSESAMPNSPQSSVIDAAPTGSGTTDYIPLWTSGSNLGNSLLFQTGGKLGVGTTSPASTLDINGGEILRGGFYEYAQGTATRASGQPSHSFQWDASVWNGDTGAPANYAFGFRAMPVNNGSSQPAASLDLFYGSGGPDGSLTDLGLSISSTGIITFPPGQNFPGTLNLPEGGTISVDGTRLIATNDPTEAVFGVGAMGYGVDNTGSVAVGNNAMGQAQGVTNSVAVGSESLALANGYNGATSDVAVGSAALQDDTTGSYNTAIGLAALFFNTSGNYNVGVGDRSGNANQSGSEITAIGADAGPSVDGLQNATAIGAYATVATSNSLVLGSLKGVNGATSNVNVGIGVSAPAYTFEVIDTGMGPGTAAIVGSTSYAGHNGVYGVANVTSGGSNGGYFLSNSPSGAGVVGTNTGGGLAASFQGNVQITGTLTKGGGSFKIDDPIDPAGKYLSHSFVESPDMMNIYNGSVILNAKGEAVVTMPKWFSALNRDFQYQLTAIGGPAPHLYVATEIQDNRFTIAGGKKGQKISWMVTGIRQDAWANAHRIPTEEEKPPSEQGHYLHPELYGEGADKSVVAGGAIATAPLNGGH